MLKFLRKYWIEISFFDVSLDLEDCVSIDIFNIMAGSSNGIKFKGSLLMLYMETDIHCLPRKVHFCWDLFYIRQWKEKR